MRLRVPLVYDESDDARRPDVPRGVRVGIVQEHADGTVTVEVNERDLPYTDKPTIARRLAQVPGDARRLRAHMRKREREAERGDDDAAHMLNLWESVTRIPHHAPEWPMLVAEFEEALGSPARAAEVLAPSAPD